MRKVNVYSCSWESLTSFKVIEWSKRLSILSNQCSQTVIPSLFTDPVSMLNAFWTSWPTKCSEKYLLVSPFSIFYLFSENLCAYLERTTRIPDSCVLSLLSDPKLTASVLFSVSLLLHLIFHVLSSRYHLPFVSCNPCVCRSSSSLPFHSHSLTKNSPIISQKPLSSGHAWDQRTSSKVPNSGLQFHRYERRDGHHSFPLFLSLASFFRVFVFCYPSC